MIKFLCDRCSALIENSRVRFTMKVELFAAYDGLEIESKEELGERDLQKEIRRLIEKMQDMDARELEREVYTRYEFDLCKNCRDELARQLDSRKLP